MKYIIDASVAIRWFIKDETHPNADLILSQLLLDPVYFAVPELFAFEVFAVLSRLHPDKAVYVDGFLPLLNGGILRYPMTDELAEAAGKYLSAGLSGYDSTYAALAEILGATWLTFDRKAHTTIKDFGRSESLFEKFPEFSL